MDNFLISKSQRGGDLLIHQGHEFLRSKPVVSCNGFKWRCRKYQKFRCSATITTANDKIIKKSGTHSHLGDSINTEVTVVRSNIKEAAKNKQHSSTCNLIADEVMSAHTDVLHRLPKRSTLNRMTRRAKVGNPHSNPTSRSFDIPPMYNDIVLYDTGEQDEHRIIVVGCLDVLRYANTDIWFADGTFDIVPSLFFQLYTIHGKIGNSYPPFLYFLLPNKTENTYKRMLQILKSLKSDLAPHKIFVDFELASINAFKAEFPNSQVRGCFFHLSQSALSFVPVSDVAEILGLLLAQFPDEPEMDQLLSYFTSTYVTGIAVLGHHRPPRFPPAMWNNYGEAISCAAKTTNCVEGYHNSLRSLFLCSHPTVWSLFDGLKRDMALQRLTVQNVVVQNLERPRNKYVVLANRLSL